MAACLITVSGTSGVIRINYTIGAVPYTIETSVGEFYIEDTATDVTYTTLSGDLIATDDGCLTPSIAELPATCYIISWEKLSITGYAANAILLGGDTIVISDTEFPITKFNLVDSINGADDDRVKVIGYLFSSVGSTTTYSYLLKVLGTELPILRVRNADSTQFIYIHGVLQANCLPKPGYEIVDPCYSTLPKL